ncbi:hypothetical protein PHLCEN_2v13110 [Hermanssonia centrifuga]|uniref:Uncharacterized protein n=1 Tax=Hermanssonia centrifuga TaxID=98765 RepID=A0A2R6NF75_9APHY|nr:hypothetical protein PHLCEN_2v13110 [Hermanssonia centrifuga]
MVDLAIIDDSNVERLTYTGSWSPQGSPPSEWNGTTHGSPGGGSQVIFEFNGTNVEVYGTIGGAAVSTYALDLSPPSTFTAPNTSATVYQQRLFQSPTLQDGSHTLVITVISQGPFFWLDYLLYTPSSENLAVVPLSASFTTSGSISPMGSATSSTSFSLGTSTSSATSSSLSCTPAGTIAGAVVGGLLLLSLFAAGLLFYWKKRDSRRRGEASKAFEFSASQPVQTFISPFPPPSSSHSPYTSTVYPLSVAKLPSNGYSQSLDHRVFNDRGSSSTSFSIPEGLSSNSPLRPISMDASHIAVINTSEHEGRIEFREGVKLKGLPPAYQAIQRTFVDTVRD